MKGSQDISTKMQLIIMEIRVYTEVCTNFAGTANNVILNMERNDSVMRRVYPFDERASLAKLSSRFTGLVLWE